MKVGDLVKFKPCVRGFEKLVGTIIEENGEGFDVLWSKDISSPALMKQQDGRIQTEFPEFLEVINEAP